MTYLVKELSNLPSNGSLQSAVEKSSYPNTRKGSESRASIDSLVDDVIVTHSLLALVPSQKDANRRWEKAKNIFGQTVTY